MNRNIFLSIGLIVQCINISNIKTASIPISHQHIDSLAITNVENDPTYESKFEDDKVTSLLGEI